MRIGDDITNACRRSGINGTNIPIGTKVTYEFGFDRSPKLCTVVLKDGRKWLALPHNAALVHGQNGKAIIHSLPN